MLTRALATLTLLLALTGQAGPTVPAATRRARSADDIGGCREPAPAPVPAPAACGDEVRP